MSYNFQRAFTSTLQISIRNQGSEKVNDLPMNTVLVSDRQTWDLNQDLPLSSGPFLDIATKDGFN